MGCQGPEHPHPSCRRSQSSTQLLMGPITCSGRRSFTICQAHPRVSWVRKVGFIRQLLQTSSTYADRWWPSGQFFSSLTKLPFFLLCEKTGQHRSRAPSLPWQIYPQHTQHGPQISLPVYTGTWGKRLLLSLSMLALCRPPIKPILYNILRDIVNYVAMPQVLLQDRWWLQQIFLPWQSYPLDISTATVFSTGQGM